MRVAEVQGRSVLVIGATRGIGKAIAERFAALGAHVGVTGRESEAASRAANDIAARYGTAVATYTLDVTHRDEIPAVVQRFRADHDGIDSLVYNAGTSPVFTSAEKIPEDAWDAIIATNLTGAFLAAQEAARQLIQTQRPGTITFIGSALGDAGAARLVAYAASKAGIAGMARGMALDWARYGIRVNTVAPGWVATDFTSGLRQHAEINRSLTERTPLGRFATPEEIADLVVFLSSDSARFVTGAVYHVDGGWTAQ